MFARMLTMSVKSGQGPALAAAVEEKVVPTLRKFKGFRDQLTMISPDGDLVAMSFWDSAPDAGMYECTDWNSVFDLYRTFAVGTPKLSTYDLVVSTAYQLHGTAVGA